MNLFILPHRNQSEPIVERMADGLIDFPKFRLVQLDNLAVISYGVSYGKELRLKGYQKSVFLLMQQRYALALMGNARLEESRRYLNEEWSGKKKERLYKQTVLNLNLVEAYQQQDADRYNELYDRADRSIKRNKLFGAEKLFLEHQYKQAIDFLEGYRVRTAYDKVIRSYLLGQ